MVRLQHTVNLVLFVLVVWCDRRQTVIEAHAKAHESKQKAKPDQAVHMPLTMVEVTKILAQQWRDVSATHPSSP